MVFDKDTYDVSPFCALEYGYIQPDVEQFHLGRVLASTKWRDIGRFRRTVRISQEKMPPRFAFKGLSLAARSLGHEIRYFTQRTTGKDLAMLANNRPEIFNKIETTAIKITKGSKNTLRKTLLTFQGMSFLASIKFDDGKDSISNLENTSEADIIHGNSITSNFELVNSDIISSKHLQSVLDSCTSANLSKEPCEEEQWERFMRERNVSAWRRRLPGSQLYQYRVHGSFNDVSAWNFYQTQMDIEYRKQWDRFALKMDVVGTDTNNKSDVIHWITQFPYPLKCREYVFVRRSQVDEKSKSIALISKSASHPYVEENNELVRIDKYESEMVIKSHNHLKEPGMDFLLTYYDDLKSNVPSYCLDMIVSSGLSEGMQKIYNAAKQLSSLKLE